MFAMDVAGTTVDGTATYNYYDRTDGVRVEPGQIQSATYSPGFQASEAYSYDATGNRTMSGYSTGPVNRMTSDGVFNYIYDGEGNRDLRTRISGAPANDYTTDYDWDYQNRLTKVTFKNNSGVVTKTVEYGYDPWNNLVWRSVDADGAGAGAAVKTYFVNDGTEAVLALSPTGAVKDRYLWAPSIDQVMADEQPGTGELLWTFTDNLGTVRELARYTGGVTSVANHRVFDSYGQLKSETNAAVDHLFAFTGRMLDEDTGLQQHLNRWYDPKVGRWLSEDPIGFNGGMNLYGYVGNHPANATDPSGLRIVKCVLANGSQGMTSRLGTVPDTWNGGDPCPVLFGVGPPPWVETPLTADQSAVSKLCKGNAACEASLATLMGQIEKVPGQWGANKCFKWADAFLGNHPSYNGSSPIVLPGGIVVEPLNVPTTNPNGVVTYYSCFGLAVRRYYNHCIFKVTLPGGKVAYFDIGSNTDLGNFGGDDHWWYPGSPEDDLDYYLDTKNACRYKCGDYKQ